MLDVKSFVFQIISDTGALKHGRVDLRRIAKYYNISLLDSSDRPSFDTSKVLSCIGQDSDGFYIAVSDLLSARERNVEYASMLSFFLLIKDRGSQPSKGYMFNKPYNFKSITEFCIASAVGEVLVTYGLSGKHLKILDSKNVDVKIASLAKKLNVPTSLVMKRLGEESLGSRTQLDVSNSTIFVGGKRSVSP